MDTDSQLYRVERKPIACALREPSITLVQNDSVFGLLVAAGRHEDSFSGRLYLEDVAYLAIRGTEWEYRDYESVAVYQNEGIWFAQDLASSGLFPNPRRVSFPMLHISEADYERLMLFRRIDVSRQVFKFAQRSFGELAGFAYFSDTLVSPDGFNENVVTVWQSDLISVAYRKRLRARGRTSRVIAAARSRLSDVIQYGLKNIPGIAKSGDNMRVKLRRSVPLE